MKRNEVVFTEHELIYELRPILYIFQKLKKSGFPVSLPNFLTVEKVTKDERNQIMNEALKKISGKSWTITSSPDPDRNLVISWKVAE